MKRALFSVVTLAVVIITFLANTELTSACALGLYQPELPEE